MSARLFLTARDLAKHLELHVVWDIRQLQQIFPYGGIERVESEIDRLSDNCAGAPERIHASTHVEIDFASAHLCISVPRLWFRRFGPESVLRTTACQSTYTSLSKPTCSPTALLSKPSCHRRAKSTPLALVCAYPL